MDQQGRLHKAIFTQSVHFYSYFFLICNLWCSHTVSTSNSERKLGNWEFSKFSLVLSSFLSHAINIYMNILLQLRTCMCFLSLYSASFKFTVFCHCPFQALFLPLSKSFRLSRKISTSSALPPVGYSHYHLTSSGIMLYGVASHGSQTTTFCIPG